jgi:hypothetical protein
MATNPQFPPERPRRDDHARMELTQKRNPWWPVVLIVIAVAILIGLIAWLATAPQQRQPTTQVAGDQVQLTNLTAGPASSSGEMDVHGNLLNNTGGSVAGMTVEATFRNIRGEELKKVNAEVTTPRGTLAEKPIAAGATQEIVVHFARVPEGWNGNTPDLRVAQVQRGQ